MEPSAQSKVDSICEIMVRRAIMVSICDVHMREKAEAGIRMLRSAPRYPVDREFEYVNKYLGPMLGPQYVCTGGGLCATALHFCEDNRKCIIRRVCVTELLSGAHANVSEPADW
eukprot:scaffold200403_cov23-Tisochrysis_lutea.AAC.2